MAPVLVFTLCLLLYWNIEPCFTPSAQKCSDKINKKNQNTEFRWFEGNLLKYMLCFISTTWAKDNFLCWNLPEKTCMAWCVVSWSGAIVFKKSQWMYHCMKRMLLRHYFFYLKTDWNRKILCFFYLQFLYVVNVGYFCTRKLWTNPKNDKGFTWRWNGNVSLKTSAEIGKTKWVGYSLGVPIRRDTYRQTFGAFPQAGICISITTGLLSSHRPSLESHKYELSMATQPCLRGSSRVGWSESWDVTAACLDMGWHTLAPFQRKSIWTWLGLCRPIKLVMEKQISVPWFDLAWPKVPMDCTLD